MNDQQLEKKVSQDAAKVQKELNTLVGDSAARVGRFGENVTQATDKAKEDITTWVEDSAAHVSKGFEKFTDHAQETAEDAAATMKKQVGHRLNQYNTMMQDAADNLPKGVAKQITRYPWVVITVGLVIGILLGLLLRPSQQMADQGQNYGN